jgi:hypothetical protein
MDDARGVGGAERQHHLHADLQRDRHGQHHFLGGQPRERDAEVVAVMMGADAADAAIHHAHVLVVQDGRVAQRRHLPRDFDHRTPVVGVREARREELERDLARAVLQAAVVLADLARFDARDQLVGVRHRLRGSGGQERTRCHRPRAARKARRLLAKARGEV